MKTAERISRLGFKRWYERQLIESHAYLVTCFLSLILVVAVLEVFSLRNSGLDTAIRVLVAVAGGWLCVVTLARYTQSLKLAERLGEAATCRQCRSYAAFNVITAGPRDTPGDEYRFHPRPRDETWLRVRCRKCGNEWTM